MKINRFPKYKKPLVTVGWLIKQLQKYDSSLPVFVDGMLEIEPAQNVFKIKFDKTEKEEVHLYTKEEDKYRPEVIKYKRDVYNKKSIYTKFTDGLLISEFPDYSKKNKK